MRKAMFIIYGCSTAVGLAVSYFSYSDWSWIKGKFMPSAGMGAVLFFVAYFAIMIGIRIVNKKYFDKLVCHIKERGAKKKPLLHMSDTAPTAKKKPSKALYMATVQTTKNTVLRWLDDHPLEIGTLSEFRKGQQDFSSWGNGVIVGSLDWIADKLAATLAALNAGPLSLSQSTDYSWQKSKLAGFTVRIQVSLPNGSLGGYYIGHVGDDSYGLFGFSIDFDEEQIIAEKTSTELAAESEVGAAGAIAFPEQTKVVAPEYTQHIVDEDRKDTIAMAKIEKVEIYFEPQGAVKMTMQFGAQVSIPLQKGIPAAIQTADQVLLMGGSLATYASDQSLNVQITDEKSDAEWATFISGKCPQNTQWKRWNGETTQGRWNVIVFLIESSEVKDIKAKGSMVNKTDEINTLAMRGTETCIVKLIRMSGEAANSGDIEMLKKIQSAMKAHVPIERYIAAGETLPMNEQITINEAVMKYKDVL